MNTAGGEVILAKQQARPRGGRKTQAMMVEEGRFPVNTSFKLIYLLPRGTVQAARSDARRGFLHESRRDQSRIRPLLQPAGRARGRAPARSFESRRDSAPDGADAADDLQHRPGARARRAGACHRKAPSRHRPSTQASCALDCLPWVVPAPPAVPLLSASCASQCPLSQPNSTP